MGFASIRKNTTLVREITHQRKVAFAEGARITRVSAVLLMTFDAEFSPLGATEEFIVGRAVGIMA